MNKDTKYCLTFLLSIALLCLTYWFVESYDFLDDKNGTLRGNTTTGALKNCGDCEVGDVNCCDQLIGAGGMMYTPMDIISPAFNLIKGE